jgi:hypothetical protein
MYGSLPPQVCCERLAAQEGSFRRSVADLPTGKFVQEHDVLEQSIHQLVNLVIE